MTTDSVTKIIMRCTKCGKILEPHFFCDCDDKKLAVMQAVVDAAQEIGVIVYQIFVDLNADDTLCIGDMEQPLRAAYDNLKKSVDELMALE